MKIAIVGTRTFNDYGLLRSIMQRYETVATLVISGGARGADKLAERWSSDFLKKEAKVIHADWKDTDHPDAILKTDRSGNFYNAQAGIVRNRQIVAEADLVIAFWDGISKGTKHTILHARNQKKEVQVIKYQEMAQLVLPF